MILYKYTSREGMKAIIKGASLLVRPLNGFNDPFESVPVMTYESARQMATRILNRSDVLRLMADDPEINPRHFSPPQLRILLRDDSFKSVVIQTLARRSQIAPLEFAKSLQDWFSEFFGLVCLTSSPANLLMWSHYAEHHYGFMFAIETSFWDPDTTAKVNYSEHRVSFPSGEPTLAEIQNVVTTKSIDWQYEAEYRILCQVNAWQIKDGKKLKNEPG